MSAARSLALLLALSLAVAAALPPRHVRARRQLADDINTLDEEGYEGDEQTREKRKLEGATEAKFGVKNAILGFVFGKINSLIDAKTRLVDTLDRQNIEINKQYGIEAPHNGGGGLASLTGIVGQVIGPKLQLLGPKIQAVTGLFGGSSGSGGGSSGGQEWHYVAAPGAAHAHEPIVVGHPSPASGYASPAPGYASPAPGYASPAPGYSSPAPGYHHGQHPGVRPQQGQLGLPGQPIWAFGVPAHSQH